MLIEIPRCYSESLQNTKYLEIHTFCDASEEAYTSASYLQIVLENKVDVVLVFSKTSLKTLTIPKLALLATVMGGRLSQLVEEQLGLKIINKYF